MESKPFGFKIYTMYKLSLFDIGFGFKCVYNIQLSILNEMKDMQGEYVDYQRDKWKWNLIPVSNRNEFKYKGMVVCDYDYAIEQVYKINCKD